MSIIPHKPAFISHYLVLIDLIDGIDPRAKSDVIFYLCSRIENIKCDFTKSGLLFEEEAKSYTTYSHYKPYVLVRTETNMKLAKELLEKYKTEKVIDFLSRRHAIQESQD